MRLVHTMIRCSNEIKSQEFYTRVLGMTVQRRLVKSDYTLLYLGYGSAPRHHELELTINNDNRSLELGTAWGHIAIWVNNSADIVQKAKDLGYDVVKEPKIDPDFNVITAFIKDPDGHSIELIEVSRD